NVNAYYLLNNTTVDTARSVLSLFNKQHPIFHDSDCIDAVRKQNVYFNGLVSIILTDFCNEVQEVNGLTLDALLLGKGKQPIPLIIDEYIHEKARKCYDKPIYNMPFNKDLGFILVHDPIFRTKLYGQGHEIIPGSVQVSNDDCYIKAEDTAGHVLVWDISTGERVALSSPQTYWTPMADHVPSVNNGVTNESKKCMAVVVKDKKITYQENDFLFEDNYSQDGQVPALILVVKPTWHDEIIYTALMKSYSVEQHQALLKSKSLRLMHPFVRANLKAYLRYILQSWENNAELVQ